MDILKKTLELCRVYGIKPARSRGQNFLIEEDFYNKIIEAAELRKEDTVLEVGPGLGFLTAKLAKNAGKVIAVELDDKLAEILKTGLKAQGVENVDVINEDVLKINTFKLLQNCHCEESRPESGRGDEAICDGSSKAPTIKDCHAPLRSARNDNRIRYKIVANLPYNITSYFLRKFLSEDPKPESMVLMLQKEVAQRIAAKPGEMSLLAVSVQFYAEPKIIAKVPASAFWPKPEVDSAIVKIIPHPIPLLGKERGNLLPLAKGGKKVPLIRGIEGGKEGEIIQPPLPPLSRGRVNEKEFFRLVRIGFSSKRKMLKNNLANGYHIEQARAEQWLSAVGLEAKIRAQELAVGDWLKLLEAVPANML